MKCEYCEHNKPHCLAKGGLTGWAVCTREANHDGPHVACGIVDHKVLTWKHDKHEPDKKD